MLFKKKEIKDYVKQVEFCFYSWEVAIFYDFLSELKLLGIQVNNVIGENEYISDFDRVIAQDIDKGLIILFSDKSSSNVVFKNHNGRKLLRFSLRFFYSDHRLFEQINYFVAKSKGIYYAYLNSFHDMKWQGEESIIVYERNKKSLKGLSYTTNVFGERCVDVSRNFGRGIFREGIGFAAAYTSWFGDITREFRDVDFEHDFKLSVLEKNGLIKIKLFDDLFTDYEYVRLIQKDFLLKLRLV